MVIDPGTTTLVTIMPPNSMERFLQSPTLPDLIVVMVVVLGISYCLSKYYTPKPVYGLLVVVSLLVGILCAIVTSSVSRQVYSGTAVLTEYGYPHRLCQTLTGFPDGPGIPPLQKGLSFSNTGACSPTTSPTYFIFNILTYSSVIYLLLVIVKVCIPQLRKREK